VLFPTTEEMMNNWSNKLAWALCLSYGQKTMFSWVTLDGQVGNGGFVQFYYNGYGWYIPTILKGLAHIGEEKVAALIRKAHDLYLRDKDIMDEGMEGDLFGSDLYEQMDELSALDNEYYKISYSVFDVLDPYVRAHPCEFCVDEEGEEIDPLLTGEFRHYYPDGAIRDSFSINKGQLIGRFKRYYPCGQLMEQLVYDAGRFTGEKEEFYETGILKCRTSQVEGKEWIRWEWFFDDGTPEKIEHRTKNFDTMLRDGTFYRSLYWDGMHIGEYKEWYRNGQLRTCYTHLSHHKYTGKYLKYHENGMIEYEIEYDDTGEQVSRYYNPRPTTGELIQICLTADDLEKVKESARKLYSNEYDQYEFREQLISRLEAIDLAGLNEKEKQRLMMIIREAELEDGTNKRPVVGKHLWEINQDAAFYRALAERTKAILDRLLFWFPAGAFQLFAFAPIP
jgi:antitoxin component YwqK of YwqJK toxin-antitoxin module